MYCKMFFINLNSMWLTFRPVGVCQKNTESSTCAYRGMWRSSCAWRFYAQLPLHYHSMPSINSCITTPSPITVSTCVSNLVVSCSHTYKCDDLVEVVTDMKLWGRAGSLCVLRYVYLCVHKLRFDILSLPDSFLLTQSEEYLQTLICILHSQYTKFVVVKGCLMVIT